MIALLALNPIRSKNFASLALDKSFVRQGDSWCLCLHARETKAGRADERQVDEILNPAIALYRKHTAWTALRASAARS